MEYKNVARRIATTEAIVEKAYEVSHILDVHTEPIVNHWDYNFSVVNLEHMDAALGALKSIPFHTLESYDMVVGVHDLTLALSALVPYAEFHSKSGDVHYTFEGDDKSQVKYYCDQVKKARDLVRTSIVELGHKTKE